MRPLVIGVGNRWRSDDGVGPRVVDELVATRSVDVDTLVLDGEPTRLVTAWEGRSHVVVVDAIRAGSAPGTIHCVDPLEQDLVPATSPSTHGAGLAGAVALARSLDRLPGTLVVVGVEPASFAHGDALSPDVATTFPDLVERVAAEACSQTSASDL